MKILNPDLNLEEFFGRLAQAGGLLALDYDGTLAPFTPERDQARPYPGLAEVLAGLLRRRACRVVIVSGRPVRDLPGLLGLDPWPEIWGSHGAERLRPDGTRTLAGLGHETAAGLARAEAWGRDQSWAGHLEPKPVGLALHWRGLGPAAADEMRRRATQEWTPLARRAGLALLPFDGGLELRLPNLDKGRALETLLAEIEPDAPAAYLGDDLTDEDAFRVLRERGRAGLAVLVRPTWRQTLADLWLVPPQELLDFLRRFERTSP